MQGNISNDREEVTIALKEIQDSQIVNFCLDFNCQPLWNNYKFMTRTQSIKKHGCQGITTLMDFFDKNEKLGNYLKKKTKYSNQLFNIYRRKKSCIFRLKKIQLHYVTY